MRFHERLLSLRKSRGLSQEELGMELQVSRQTISKWEAGQSYPDFQRLVLLSDFFGLTLDELVKGVDVQDVRDRGQTSEQVAALYQDWERAKDWCRKEMTAMCVLLLGVAALLVVSFLAHLAFPDIPWLWRQG